SADHDDQPEDEHTPLLFTTPSQQQRPPRQPLQKSWGCNRLQLRVAIILGGSLIICLLILVLSGFAAQRVLDNGLELKIQKADIYDMDQTGFQISIKSTLRLDSSNDGLGGLTNLLERIFHPTMTIGETMLTMGLPSENSDQEQFMAQFPLSSQKLRMGDTLELNISSHAQVTNATMMAEFFHSTFASSRVSLALRGPVVTRLGYLWPMNLQMNQIVVVDGLSGLQDAALVSLSLPGDDPQGGITMSSTARIKNPSKIVSLRMGRVTFGIFLPSKAHPDVDLYKIAEVQCAELRLDAEQSHDISLAGRLFHMDDWILVETGQSGQLLPKIAKGSLGSEKEVLLGELMSRFIQGTNSTIQVRALASKDANLPRWLAESFKSIALSMVFPGSPTKDFIRSLNMNQLHFGFAESPKNHQEWDDPLSALINGNLSSQLQLPPNVTFPIKVLKMKPRVQMLTGQGVEMATMNLPTFLPTLSSQEESILNVQLAIEKPVQLEVNQKHLPEFYQFLNDSFINDKIVLGVAGDALALVETGLGTFELGPISFHVNTTQKGKFLPPFFFFFLTGLGGLITTPPILESLDVVDSTNESLTIQANLTLWNPSNISASLGDLSFLWAYNGYLIGIATVPGAQLVTGNNTIECIGMLDPTIHCRKQGHRKSRFLSLGQTDFGEDNGGCNPDLARNASREFMSRYISGDNRTSIHILGYEGSTRIPLLQSMLSTFAIESTLPTIEQNFLLSSTLYLLTSSLVLELQNPLDAVITVLYLNATASFKDEPLGHVLVDFERDASTPKPIIIPANDHQNETSGYTKTPRLPASFYMSSVGYEALKRALGGTLEVDVDCHIKAKVGAMIMWVDYARENVPTNVRKGFF
ncbi:hypothetical protein BGW38_009782, partial [Lunasporangiospora selenospora]